MKLERDDVSAFGSRRDREKALRAAAESIRAACNADDAGDRILGMLCLVVRMKTDRTPDVALRNLVVWGEDGLAVLAEAARETIVHAAERMSITVGRKRKGH